LLRNHLRKNNYNIMKGTSIIWAFVLGLLIITGLLFMEGISDSPAGGDNLTGNISVAKKVLLKTTLGDITIELYDDMPITTGNFENLVEKGTYDGVIFHRIIPGFMIQGGDPTGTGYGDPTIPNIKDEFTHAGGNRNDRGTISMANAGPNTGSSQFFINLVDNSFLDTKHPAFGKVVDGMDIVDKLGKVQTGQGDRPVDEVKIIKAEMI